METPITFKELENWVGTGAAIMLENNIVLVPEISDKKGAFYNIYPNENKDAWIVNMKVTMGND